MDAWALAGIALVLMGYAAVSGRLATTPVTQAMVFVAVGLLAGNRALGPIEADAAGQFVRHLAEATLALVLFTDAVRVNLGRLRRESLVPARLLGVGLPLTIVAGTLAGLALLPGLDLWTAAALATMLAPTDAALGLPVVSNRRLPSRIRQGLNVESGLNDGVCVPLLIIFLTIAEAEQGPAHVEPLRVILEEIGFGAAGGLAAGALGAFVLRGFAARGWTEGAWRQINAVATPLLAYTVASALGGSGFIAAFVAGIVFGALTGERGEATTYLAEESGELLNAVTFLLFGAVLLGPALGDPDWRVIGYAALSLTVVRLLPVARCHAGHGHAPGDRRLPGLVRAPRPGLDRIRAHPGRADRPARAAAAAGRGDLDGRPFGVRPRPDRLAGRQPLRRLVRCPRQGPPGHARERPSQRAACPCPRSPRRRLTADRAIRHEGAFVVL